MSPLLTMGAGISVLPLGFGRGGTPDSYYIASVATGFTSYSCSSFQTPLGLLTWSFYDQNGRHFWAAIDKAGIVNYTRSIAMYSYAYTQNNVMATETGTVYISGMSTQFGPPTYLQPLKVSSGGTIQWQRYLGSLTGAVGACLAIDPSENVIVSQRLNAATNTPFTVAKYNTNGTIQWQRTYSSSGLNFRRFDSIAVNASSIYVGGGFSQFDYQQGAGVLKLDQNGNVAWCRNTFGVAPPTHVATDSNDNVYVLRPNYITKYNSSGTHQWTRYMNSLGTAYMGIACDPAGNVYVADGTTTVYVYKYNTNGVLQWQRSITRSGGQLVVGSSWNNSAHSVMSATSSSVSLACTDNSQAILFKLPGDGSITGTFTVGGLAYTIANSSTTESSTSEPYSTITVTGSAQGATDGANNFSVTTQTPTYTRKVMP